MRAQNCTPAFGKLSPMALVKRPLRLLQPHLPFRWKCRSWGNIIHCSEQNDPNGPRAVQPDNALPKPAGRRSQSLPELGLLCRVINYAELLRRFSRKLKKSPLFIFATWHNSMGLMHATIWVCRIHHEAGLPNVRGENLKTSNDRVSGKIH